MTEFELQMQELYGPLPHYHEHSIGDVITYRVDGETYQGEILWVCAPYQNARGRQLPGRYIVSRQGRENSFPDEIWFSDALVDTQETQEPGLLKCPYCLAWHYAGQRCPLQPWPRED